MKTSEVARTRVRIPLVRGGEGDRVRRALQGIAEALRDVLKRKELVGNPTLESGSAGLALFFLHLHRASPLQEWEDLAQEALDQTLDAARDMGDRWGLFNGFLGVAWLLEHIQGWIVDVDPPLNEEADRALALHLERIKDQVPAEWCHGLAGAGLYSLERLRRTGNHGLVRRVLDLLLSTSRRDDIGRAWPQDPGFLPPEARGNFPGGHVGLGTAHGLPGTIGFLGLALQAGAMEPRHRPLLEEAVHWLLAHREPPGSGFRLPRARAWSGPGPCEPTRVAWCYGDLGASMGLLRAAHGSGREDWRAAAEALARDAAALPVGSRHERDACLCHGTVGNAHLFHRWYRTTGDPLFRDKAREWLDATWALENTGQGPGGFLYWHPRGGDEDPSPWKSRPGLLGGLSGTGLGLLAALGPSGPPWDRLLLAS